jgi:catechol 2,3-dioxygenase-like lactoylglutathione lyase family enzyme
VDHLALPVTDQARSLRFYEEWLGFDAATARTAEDGTILVTDGAGFTLALGQADGPVTLPAFLHFGRRLESPDEVRRQRSLVEHAGVPIVETWDEPDYVSVKLSDPDGYVIELYWEAA